MGGRGPQGPRAVGEEVAPKGDREAHGAFISSLPQGREGREWAGPQDRSPGPGHLGGGSPCKDAWPGQALLPIKRVTLVPTLQRLTLGPGYGNLGAT